MDSVSYSCDVIDAFRCGDGTCIQEMFKCNGVSECRNGLDEKVCGKATDTMFSVHSIRVCKSHADI